MKASIIICTHDHLESLRATMEALANVRVPDGIETELLLVENACTDETAAFVKTAQLPNMLCRALHEPVKGQVRARNRGLAVAEGDFILFTDDDVRPANDWLEKLCARLVAGECDAVIGQVILARHLERPWMNRRLRATLAITEGLEDGWLTEMVGANMGFHRRVLEKVPQFDEELGPGALGFGDDSLFSWQIEAAGFRLGRAPEAVVEHHCDASRLLRRNYLESARKSGQSHAYLLHHWRHEKICYPYARLALAQLKLLRRRLISSRDSTRLEGCADWEFSLHAELWRYRQYLHERQRPRNYAKRGLEKITAQSRGQMPA